MIKTLLTAVIALMIVVSASAGIHCPQEATIYCDDDYDDTSLTGRAVLLGQHYYYPLKYKDTKVLNSCGIGYIDRTWFGDANNNGLPDPIEPQCTQRINILSKIQPIIITWPNDITVSCMADIPDTRPSWVAGPCDVIGVSTRDHQYELDGDACLKIVREFKLINWCDHGPDVQNEWTHKQIIKVIDEYKPVINDCKVKEFYVGEDCTSEVILQNSAYDPSLCAAGKLFWVAEVDLWADGGIDYEFAYYKTGESLITPKDNNEIVSIKIPELLKPGKHKVHWRVKDACGNYQHCTTQFYTTDKKPPTPYCLDFTTITFNKAHMDFIELNADFFNFSSGSVDNCTKKDQLRYSFSPDVADTIRRIDCFSTGFNFFEIYVTDENGNQDFCDVFTLVFDNGSCSSNIDATGRVIKANGDYVSNPQLSLFLDDTILDRSVPIDDSIFAFHDMPLFEESYVKLTSVDDYPSAYAPTLGDYLVLRDFLLGRITLDELSKVAADLHADGILDIKDLKNYADWLLGRNNVELDNIHFVALPAEFYKDNSVSRIVASEVLPLKQYKGNMDFMVAPKGQLTNANIGLRNGAVIFSVEEVEDKLLLYSVQDMKLRGALIKNIANEFAEDLMAEIASSGASMQKHEKDGMANLLIEQNLELTAGELFIALPKGFEINSENFELISSDSYHAMEIKLFHQKPTDQSSIKNFLIYPNPAGQRLTITGSPVEKIEIFDSKGVKRVTFLYDGKSNIVEMTLPEGLESGIYTMLLMHGGETTFTKLVKTQ